MSLASSPAAKPTTISVFSFVMITSAVVLSVRTLPMTASVGMLTVTLTMLAAICFLIPSSLVAAELATTYPEDGGMFVWVRLPEGLNAQALRDKIREVCHEA